MERGDGAAPCAALPSACLAAARTARPDARAAALEDTVQCAPCAPAELPRTVEAGCSSAGAYNDTASLLGADVAGGQTRCAGFAGSDDDAVAGAEKPLLRAASSASGGALLASCCLPSELASGEAEGGKGYSEHPDALAAELTAPLAAMKALCPRTAATVVALLNSALQVLPARGQAGPPASPPPSRVVAAAAAVALSRGWLCTASALLTRLAEAPYPCLNAQGVQEAYVLRDATGRTLLHAALCSVAPAAATALLTRHAGFRAGHGRFGSAAAADARGTTPAHLAAAAMTAAPGPADVAPAQALADADATTPIAWFRGRDAAGGTPAAAVAGCSDAAVVAFTKAQAARLAAGSAAAREACRAAVLAEMWREAPELQVQAGLDRLAGAQGDEAAVAREGLRRVLRQLCAAADMGYCSCGEASLNEGDGDGSICAGDEALSHGALTALSAAEKLASAKLTATAQS